MILKTAFAILFLVAAAAPSSAADAAFARWLESLWPRAQTLGVSRATFEAVTRGLEPDLKLPDLVIAGRPDAQPGGQAEFIQVPSDYLREVSLARLADQGRKLAADHRVTLRAIEQRFGVPPEVVLAIWGRETAYGAHKLAHNAIRVLATQAYTGRRKEMFTQEFLLALKLVQERHVKLDDMRSSWAGAMGQTQFLPSEFYKHAVDFDGDGRRDIWNSVPDTLASAAQQLSAKGWQRGQGWAYEVRAPQGMDCTIANPDFTLTLSEWLRRGYALSHNRKLAQAELDQRASLLQPAGLYGPSFLILRNYYVIKEYNFSDLYVLFVGHLSDRIAGGPAFEARWETIAQLNPLQLEKMQTVLTARGLYADKIDGKAGMKTRLALGAYQKAHAMKVDCWPSKPVLDHMQR